MNVVFTHSDRDHIGDAEMFHRRMIHPAEMAHFQEGGGVRLALYPVWEGDVIQAGDYELEVVHIPGHTPGSIALLNRKNRFLIGGDSIQKGPIFMFGPGRNFEALMASMTKLQSYKKDLDVIYACHHDLENPPETIDHVLEGSRRMLQGHETGVPQERFENKVNLYDLGKVAFFAQKNF